MIILTYLISGLSLLMSILFLVQVKVPSEAPPILWLGKLIAGALSPLWAILGAVGAVIGWVYQALWAIPIGIVGVGIMTLYIWRCTRDHNGFEKAFGIGWSDQISPEQAKHMLKKRCPIRPGECLCPGRNRRNYDTIQIYSPSFNKFYC